MFLKADINKHHVIDLNIKTNTLMGIYVTVWKLGSGNVINEVTGVDKFKIL
jgi:hypothetical protein